jgi:hypothetical protein
MGDNWNVDEDGNLTKMGTVPEANRLVVAKSGTGYTTIQAALDAIGDAVDDAEFNNDLKSRYIIEVYPGVYTENLSIPTRQIIQIRLHSAKIVGNVTWSLDGTVMDGAIQQAKLLIIGDDLRNAYNLASQPISDAVVGDVEINVIGGVGSLNFAQLHIINAGVTGDIHGTKPVGGIDFTLQLFCENAIVGNSGAGAKGFVCDAGVAGTLYASNMDTSSSFSFGKVNGQVNLNVLRNVRFRGPVDVNSTHGRWFNVEFGSGLAHDFTGSSGTIVADSNSFNSYSDNVPTKGAEIFNLIDISRFIQILAADPAATAVNRARVWYNSTDRQFKGVIDDGVGGFTIVILG